MRTQDEINVTPLIDVFLTLLIIFMVITPIQSKGLDTQIPRPGSERDVLESQKTENPAIVVSVGRDLSLRINQEVVAREKLGGRLSEIFKNRGDRTLFLRGDMELPFDEIVSIIDLAKKSGAECIGLLTGAIL
ncbi:MAG TPA: biopolymer transporter ExbD [Terriglobia bacterium]|nr:biopolymer transporter ExbD [Terriglobia bacterium]